MTQISQIFNGFISGLSIVNLGCRNGQAPVRSIVGVEHADFKACFFDLLHKLLNIRPADDNPAINVLLLVLAE
ncbi:hypothetical protein D3C73_1550410 [compost metagenome]